MCQLSVAAASEEGRELGARFLAACPMQLLGYSSNLTRVHVASVQVCLAEPKSIFLAPKPYLLGDHFS